MNDVLLLNADYSPVRIVDWQRAVCLLLDEKVRLVADYPGRVIHSCSLQVPWPAVVTLTRFARHLASVRFSRSNVLARDHWQCQYCGLMPRSPEGRPVRAELTLDHVVPRAWSRAGRVRLPWNGREVGVTSWENIVTACRHCNQRKAARLPEEAGMALLSRPRQPSPREGLGLLVARITVPEQWKDYLPEPLLLSA